MKNLTLLCRSATTFTASGEFDAATYRDFLTQFTDSRLGIYVASAGSGESHAMTRDEIRTLYEIAVAECKGKIPVNANPPEQHTASMTLEHSLLAAQAGVDVVNIYGPAGWHGFKPTDEEFLAFYDSVLTQFPYRTALAPNPVIGYTPSAAVVAKVCQRYKQVEAINLAGLNDLYFIQLKDALSRDIEIYVPYNSSFETLSLGASGLLGAEANIIPKTFRRYLDLLDAGDMKAAALVYADLLKVTHYLRRWHAGSPRWIKMFFTAFKRPGAGLRAPYQLPDSDQISRFAEGLVALGVPEILDAARVAGSA